MKHLVLVNILEKGSKYFYKINIIAESIVFQVI